MMKPSQLLNLLLISFVWALLPLSPISKINAAEVQVSGERLISKQLSAKEIKDLIKVGDALFSSGKLKKASIVYEQIVEGLEARADSSAHDLAFNSSKLGTLYYNQGLYSKAEPLYQRALAINEKALGPDHVNTALSLKNLAFLYYRQGLYSRSEVLYQRTLTIREKVLGLDHPDTAESLANLAAVYDDQSLYSKAEDLYRRALAIRENVLGPDHLSTATSLYSLASLYYRQGLYAKAEPLYQSILVIKEKALGPGHPGTASSLNNLATSYHFQGLYGKAESQYQRALTIREKVLGPDHPDTAISLNNLATLYDDQSLYSKAEPLYQRALSIREKVLGSDHPDTAASLNNLATLYDDQGLYGKAGSLHQRALTIREKVLGSDHPDTAASLNNLASLYHKQNLHIEAESLYQRALSITEKVLGPDHLDTANRLNNLATSYHLQNFYSQAEALYQRSLAIREKVLGLDHSTTATSLNNLATLYDNQGLYSKAEPLYQRALATREKVLGLDHPSTVESLANLATLFNSQGLYSKAEPLSRRGLSTEVRLIQREAPYLSRADRQAFVASFSSASYATFSYATQGIASANLALFSRLNRQGLLEEIEKRQAQFASLPGEQQQVVEELRALTQQLSSLSIKPEQRKALRVRQEELEKQLYRLLPELKPRIVEVEEVARVLPADGVLIEFQRYRPFDGKKPMGERWGKAKYLAMVLKPNGSIDVVDLGATDVIDLAIGKMVLGIEEKWSDLPALTEKVSYLVVDPLNKATRGNKTWFISPDGELNRLPFAALPSTDGDGYLSDAVNLRLLTTGRELLDLQQPGKASKSEVLLVADPNYGVGSKTTQAAARTQSDRDVRSTRSADFPDQLKWGRLEATAKEGKAIQGLIGGELWMGEQATAEAVKNKPAPKVLHLATHAFYLPDQNNPKPSVASGGIGDQRVNRSSVNTASLQGESPLLRSGIALAGANQPNANPNDDGYLTALEVAQLDWDGTELVVISACESGRGDIRAGEGVYGLKRAIAVAGARSSLLSLWKVDDSATAAFMESFYRRLTEGAGKGESLAETQKEFRNHPIPMWREPYVWAAFQLSGDWGPVKGLYP